MLRGIVPQNTFLLITSLIFNGFSIRKKFWKAETQGYLMPPSDLVYLVVHIILLWFMSWFKQEMTCQDRKTYKMSPLGLTEHFLFEP